MKQKHDEILRYAQDDIVYAQDDIVFRMTQIKKDN
jgi:hypothetical protein